MSSLNNQSDYSATLTAIWDRIHMGSKIDVKILEDMKSKVEEIKAVANQKLNEIAASSLKVSPGTFNMHEEDQLHWESLSERIPSLLGVIEVLKLSK